ncbi:VanW family protein [Thalassobacillus pellis]|uniref:VanW family protein n=1 Tax=Thalassobacillus pellis TaxID=748008 RepID=UPI001961B36D|nr:VanW family protein [Thalassobacillus pellis]MBM7553604.1 vancomycin resistance protein YoaR [Thalassobacillus pellis]
MKTVIVLLLLMSPMLESNNLILTHDGEEIYTSPPEQLLPHNILFPFIDQLKIDNVIGQVQEQVAKAPVDAKIGESGEIVPERVGYELHRKNFMSKLYNYLYEGGKNRFEVPLLPIHPKVDRELLANIRTQQIGHYVTYFNSHNKERSHNIKLAAKGIDSHVVFPGETFSFNKVVGKRTKEKGYKPAPVIVKGEVTEGIGGGICQVSSTLYNAVDNAGVKIKERYSHSKRVPYVPKGRDATVSWYGPDFTFKNDYNQPLLLRAKIYGGQLSVSVYSSDVIDFNSRKIPGASKKLPDEIHLDSHDNGF